MDKVSLSIVAVFVGGFLTLPLWGGSLGIPGTEAASQPAAPTGAECRAAADQMATVLAINPDQLRNPRDGVLMLPPVYWGALSEDERSNLLTMLAVQKGCADNVGAVQVKVELRSSADNRLLGSGPVLDFEELN